MNTTIQKFRQALHHDTNQGKILWEQSTMCYSSGRTGTWHSQCVDATRVTWWHKTDTKKALKYSTSRGLLTGYTTPTPWYTSTTQHVSALIFVSFSATHVHSNSQLLPNYPHNTYGRQCAEWEKTSHNLTWYQEYIQKNVRKIHARAWMLESETGIIKYTARSHGFFILVHQNGTPLWSSGQSFWLQIQRSRVQSPALPASWGQLRSYLNKKVAAPGSENRD